MFRLILIAILGSLSFSALAQDLSMDGFNKRFQLVKNEEGKVTVIKLKKATTRFSIRPFLEQLKNDLLGEQHALSNMTEQEIDDMLIELGFDPYSLVDEQGRSEAERFKEALLNIKNIDVEDTFNQLNQGDFWAEFQRRLQEALLFIDPTVLTNLEDSRFFYKKAVTYKVVAWALEEAKKRFSNIPILNIASFVIVRIHDMMLEQRFFHHNMLLHYVENVKEDRMGMTKEEVDRMVSSIYEYRIEATNYFESNRAAADWLNYGMNNFFKVVRAGTATMRDWSDPMSRNSFQNIKKVNFAFAEVTKDGVQKIYHLHSKAHMFSGKPALAYDFSKPNLVKRNRALMNLGGVVLGFLKIPDGIKSNVDKFLKSMYVQQVRLEGALVGHFESTGNTTMMKTIFAQRSNLYIVE